MAASNASTKSKAQADYVCSGTDDQVQINAALAMGEVHIQLSEGFFYITDDINLGVRDSLTGQGNSTMLSIPMEPMASCC